MAAILKLTFLLVVLLLLSDFIFAEKFIHIVMSPSAKRTKPSAENLSECSEDEILITEKEPEPKCYPKVHQIYQECKRNEQCMTKNAFCGYHESNDFQAMLCMCNLVYYASSWDNRTCVQVNRCVRPEEDNVNEGEDDNQTSNESNINATRLDCPSPLQVCQDEGVCLCVDNYTFNQYGDCVTPSEARESSNLSTENEPNNLVLYLVVGIGAATAVLIGIALTIYYVKKKKSNNSNCSKDDSTDREMELFKVSEQ